jgi:hypothetical protein
MEILEQIKNIFVVDLNRSLPNRCGGWDKVAFDWILNAAAARQ